MWCQCRKNPLNSDQRQQMVQQIIDLRKALGLTLAQFGTLLTRVTQGGTKFKKKYWIGLKYYPAYIKRWESGNPPSWWALVTMKQIADAHDIPFQLPTDAAPQRLQGGLPPGEHYQPEDKLLLTDLPASLPPMRPGRAYASSKRVRRYKPKFRRNPSEIAREIDQTFRDFKIEAPEGAVPGFIILQGQHEDPELREVSQKTYMACLSWDWREWIPLLSNPPAGEYFFCFEDKEDLAINQLMGQLRGIVKKETQSKWKISFQRVGKNTPTTNPALMNSLTDMGLDYSYSKNPEPINQEGMTWEEWYNVATVYARRAPSAQELTEMQEDWKAGVDPTDWARKLSGNRNPISPALEIRLREWCADKNLTQTQISARIKEEFGLEYGQGYISRLCLERGFRRKHDVPEELIAQLKEWCADKKLTQRQLSSLIKEKFGLSYGQSKISALCNKLGFRRIPPKTSGPTPFQKFLKEKNKLDFLRNPGQF